MSQERLRSCAEQEYRPDDLLFGMDKISSFTSCGVTGLKKNEVSGDLELQR